jgi:hypothetical protein
MQGPQAPTAGPGRGALAWAGLALLLLLEYALFREFVVREVAWSYPANHDQVVYLLQAYDTHDHVLDHGVRQGLVHGLLLPSPNGCLIHLEAALLFLLTGPTRLGALTVNFLHFALFQVALVATLRWLTRRWSVAWLGLGLLLAVSSPFLDQGGIYDFRLDFPASCLMGVLLCLVVRSGVFASPRWWPAVAGATAWLGLFRFISLVYLAGVAAVLVPWLAWRWLRRRGEERAVEARRLAGLAVTGAVLAAVTLPVLWQRWEGLKGYYVVGHLTGPEKQIRAQKDGRWYAYYPQSLVQSHLGRYFRVLAPGVLGLAALYRLRRRNRSAGDAGRLDLGVAFLAAAAALLVPVAVLSEASHRSPVVVNIALPGLLWAVLLLAIGWAGLHREGAPSPGRALVLVAGVVLAAGVANQVHWFGRRNLPLDWRTDAAEVLRLHDRIEEICAENRWGTPIVSVTSNADFLHHQVANVLMYERHGSRRVTRALLGHGILEVGADDALSEASLSDFVVLTRPRRANYPFEKCMVRLHPRLEQLCREQFREQDRYHMFGEDVVLYSRPALRLSGPANAWVGEPGFALRGPAAALRGCRALVLTGSCDFAALQHPPTPHAELIAPGRAPRPLPANLTREEAGYRVVVDCAGLADAYGDSVEVRLTFDRPPPKPDLTQYDPTRPFLRVPDDIESAR